MRTTLLVLILVLVPLLLQGGEFKRVDQWQFEDAFLSKVFCVIDKDHHILGGFARDGCRMITPDKVVPFLRFGQGPNEVTIYRTGFLYREDLAIFERADKIKVFTKKNGNYVWKATKWVKRPKNLHAIKNTIFFNNKFFVAGYESTKRKDINEMFHLKVYSDDGKPLKSLIKIDYGKDHQYILMQNFVDSYKTDTVFFMFANQLKLYVVSASKLEVIKTLHLEMPAFYKKMPESFYTSKKYKNAMKGLRLDVETWQTGYSEIQDMVVQNGQLVVQIRTANEEMKKFALLFYNADTFKLEHTEMTDDYLLDARDGKFYMFENGDPGLDEDTDSCIINIYSFKGKK